MRPGPPQLTSDLSMTDPRDSNRDPSIPDRRNYGRQKVSFSSVVINENNRGRVLNISPNGLALQTDTELIDDELPIRFNFSQLQPWVEARGRIAWRSASRKVAGIEFIHPADEVCEQIRRWIASQSELSESPKTRMPVASAQNVTTAEAGSEIAASIPALAPETVDLIAEKRGQLSTFSQVRSSAETPVSESVIAKNAASGAGVNQVIEDGSQQAIFPSVQSAAETQDPQTISEGVIAPNVAGRSSKAARLIGLSMVAALSLLAFFGLRHHLQKSGNSKKGRGMAAKLNLAGPPLKTSAAPISNTLPPLDHPAPTSNAGSLGHTTSTPSTGPSLGHPTFVVQVGAMVHEENANALAESLSQLKFPAFVFKSPTDRFHRVLVGPYNNADAAIDVQNELENLGFKAIRTKWQATSVDSPPQPTSE